MAKVINGGKNAPNHLQAEGKVGDLLSDIDEFNKKIDTKPWEGTVRDYISLVHEEKKLAQLSHARVLDMIESAGVEYDDDDTNKKRPHYKFFDGELFGVDEGVRKVVNYLKAAASGSQVGRRILLMYGPTSSGKSQLATLLKNGLEDWSKTESGAIYALSDSPMFENPLNAIPSGLRKKLRDSGIKIDPLAKLSPLMQKVLEEDYNNDWMSLPVKRIFMSEASRVGIGTFVPGDQKSQSITELVGSVDFSKLGEYGVESDPRAYKFDGELNIANRGIMEMIEMLKVDAKFLYVLLTLAQEKTIKAERFPMIYADEFILSHTNETEYKRFIGDNSMEALHDRMIVVKFPYNLQLNQEVKIYDKLISEADFGDIHIAPLTIKIASMFSILSRLEPGKDQNLTLLKKMQLYNGDSVDGFTEEDLKNIKEDADDEGMTGVSPRYIFNCIADCFTKYNLTCVTPIDVLRAIKDNFTSSPKFTKDDISRFDDLLTIVVEEFTKLAKAEIQQAFFLNFEHEIHNLLNNYVDNIGAFLDGNVVEDEFGETHKPNEYMMRSIEEKVGVSESAKDSFRQEVYRKVMSSKAKKGSFDYTTHARLKEALRGELFDSRADTIRLTVSNKNPEPEALEKLNSVIKTLVDSHGYNHESANQLLRFVSSILSK